MSTGDASGSVQEPAGDIGASAIPGGLIRLLGVGFFFFGMHSMVWGFHNAFWEVGGLLSSDKGAMEVVKGGYDVLIGLAVITVGALTAFVGLSAGRGSNAACALLKYLLCVNVALVVVDVVCSLLLDPDLRGDQPHVYPFVTTVSPTLQIPFVLAYPFASYFNYIVWLRTHPWPATQLGVAGFFVLNAVAFGALIAVEQRPVRLRRGEHIGVKALVLTMVVAVLGFGLWKMSSGLRQVQVHLWLCVVPLTLAFLVLQATPASTMSLIASFLLAGCIIPSAWLLFGCKPWGLGFAGLAGGMMFGLIGYLMARAFVNATTRTPGQKGRAVGCVLGAGVCGVLMVATGGITACYAEVGGPLFTFNALLLFLPLAAAALSPRSGKGAM